MGMEAATFDEIVAFRGERGSYNDSAGADDLRVDCSLPG